MSKRPLAVVLLSGGLDSAVAAADVARTHRLACLHASYGQRTAARELVSFGALARHFGAEQRRVIHLDHLGALGGSALTDPALAVPDAAAGGEMGRGVPVTYVPFRNAHLLAAAVSWAEVLGARAVVLGAVEEDSSGYPDCRMSFIQAFQRAVWLGTRPETDIDILTPVIRMSKADIVRHGLQLEAPFHLTWSCYRRENQACGACESCVLRLRGFEAAGAEDPVTYEHDLEEITPEPPRAGETGAGGPLPSPTAPGIPAEPVDAIEPLDPALPGAPAAPRIEDLPAATVSVRHGVPRRLTDEALAEASGGPSRRDLRVAALRSFLDKLRRP